MIDIQHDSAAGILILTPHGPISDGDVDALRDALSRLTEDGAAIRGLLIDADRFPGWEDLEAFLGHMGVIRDYHARIDRLALVSDAAFAHAADLVGHALGVQARRFPAGGRDAALAWLGSA